MAVADFHPVLSRVQRCLQWCETNATSVNTNDRAGRVRFEYGLDPPGLIGEIASQGKQRNREWQIKTFQLDASVQLSPSQSRIATARVQPAEAPRIFMGKQAT